MVLIAPLVTTRLFEWPRLFRCQSAAGPLGWPGSIRASAGSSEQASTARYVPQPQDPDEQLERPGLGLPDPRGHETADAR